MLEEALPQVIAAEPLERKLLKAAKSGGAEGITWDEQLQNAIAANVLTAEEAKVLARVRQLVLEIVAVDEFEPAELRLGSSVDAGVTQQHAA
jgi:acyl-CoA dehydrogenase